MEQGHEELDFEEDKNGSQFDHLDTMPQDFKHYPSFGTKNSKSVHENQQEFSEIQMELRLSRSKNNNELTPTHGQEPKEELPGERSNHLQVQQIDCFSLSKQSKLTG